MTVIANAVATERYMSGLRMVCFLLALQLSLTYLLTCLRGRLALRNQLFQFLLKLAVDTCQEGVLQFLTFGRQVCEFGIMSIASAFERRREMKCVTRIGVFHVDGLPQ